VEVFVIDDSAVVRQVMSAVLSHEPGWNITAASDPIIAIEKMKRVRPDVILLDLEMPRMDGLTFLRRIMAEDPIPVVVCSALAYPGTEIALRAIDEGAVDVITKPTVGLKGFLYESAILLIDTIRSASHARVRRRGLPSHVTDVKHAAIPVAPVREEPGLRITTDKVVVIGASTGGTEALQMLLESMPPDAPGLVIVQHMPEVFTKAFAQRLDASCRIEVKEAVDGDRVMQGRALIAPGNYHTLLRRSGGHYVVEVAGGPLVCRHRPSVDALFRTAAQAAGANAVGVIMTGMGHDGAQGLLEMKKSGAWTIAQDEASCVVFGMPKEAIAVGAVEEVVPLSRIPGTILDRIKRITATRKHAGAVNE
jgi:two-component system, chemotaxis family, protein-glutamate methylesterase/glutaminase